MDDILTYIANGIATNTLYYQVEEIKSGKTTNKIFLSLMQFATNYACLIPLIELFPEQASLLNHINYVANGLIILVNYLCYVFETNQLIDSGAIQASKKKLPLNLQNNHQLQLHATWLSDRIKWIQLGVYITGLGLGLFYGYGQLVVFNLLGCLLEQIYQRNLLHAHLASAYRITRMVLLSGLVMGFDNWFYIASTVLSIGFMLGDYVLTHLLGITTATIQFPIARKSHTFSFEDSGMAKPNNKKDLQKFIRSFQGKPVELTFDHMRQSSLILESISQKSKGVNYNDYNHLFLQINFEHPELKDLIEAEITANDDFFQKQPHQYITDFQLSPQATSYDIKIAYLKNEIRLMVERLQSASPRNLNHEQIEILKGQGRLILDHLKSLDPSNRQFSLIMIELALRTGSHCSRIYLECFANILRNHDLQDITALSFKEQVIVHTQKIKSELFLKFYHNFTSAFKKTYTDQNIPILSQFFQLLWSDTNDFHTYEDFALSFGSYFYLDNPTYSIRFRGISDVLSEIIFSYFLGKSDSSLIFSSHYNHVLLIREVIEGRLTADFHQWCQTFYPNAYKDFCLDENFLITYQPMAIGLAILMLLDCNIIQFKKPVSLDPQQTIEPGVYEQCCAKYHELFESKLNRPRLLSI